MKAATLQLADISEADKIRFWSKVDKNGPVREGPHYEGIGNCWVWRANRCDRGYGGFWTANRTVRAHVFSFKAFAGPVLPGQIVMHRCDEPSCVRPEHLSAGTLKENAEQMVLRNRVARGDRCGSRSKPECLARGDRHGSRTKPWCVLRGDNHPSRLRPETRPRGDCHYARTNPEKLSKGDNHHKSKLTSEKVREMRRRVTYGESRASIALAFGVSKATAREAILGISWKDVV